MEKLNMQTADAAEENIRRIAGLFPGCVTETKDPDGTLRHAIDFDKLRAELGEEQILPEGSERYEFTWPGKRRAAAFAYRPIRAALRPCREESVDFDTTHNLYIEGDNLDVLKLLRETYLGRVKMIYIDPPYNTGNDFVYKDDFRQATDDYLAASGQFDDQGQRLETNTETNGRYHTDWLNMIYPRLRLARELLTDDGVIFISIDDHEVENLKKVCNEVFGEGNFVAQFVWAAGRKNDSKYVSISHEYILTYMRNSEYVKSHEIIWRERKQGLEDIYKEYDLLKMQFGNDFKRIEDELKTWYKNLPDTHPAKNHDHYNRVDEHGIFFPDNISWPGGGGPKYEVLHPVTGKPVRVPSRGWITSKDKMAEWIKQGRVCFAEDENGVPTVKSYLKDRETTVPYSVFYKDGRASSKRLATLMGEKVFENPKDEEIIQRLIEFSGTRNNDIILDFFSGSGTTAHAVFLANVNCNFSRRFILVQVPEIISPDNARSEKAKKVANNAIALMDSINKPHTICEIGKERIRRAGAKIRAELAAKRAKEGLFAQQDAPALDTGFRVLKLASTNMEDVYYQPRDVQQKDLFGQVPNVKGDRTPLDLLFQVMLELGITLDADIREEEIAGRQVYRVNDTQLVACFEEDCPEAVVEAISRLKPLYAVVREPQNDTTMTNFDEFFKTNSPDTHRRTL